MPAAPQPGRPSAGPPRSADAPIGVFDSGVGGLSVLSALVRRLPHEDFIYLGDTARLPYGSKPAAMVRGYAFELAAELVARHYLADRPGDLRTVILGCTHYPALVPTLRAVLGPTVTLVDTAHATAEVVAEGLARLQLARPAAATAGRVQQWVTGDLENCRHVAAILGGRAGDVFPLHLPLTSGDAWTARSGVAA